MNSRYTHANITQAGRGSQAKGGIRTATADTVRSTRAGASSQVDGTSMMTYTISCMQYLIRVNDILYAMNPGLLRNILSRYVPDCM
jgi:hypothetical protein